MERNIFFRTAILSKTGVLMKQTKNLVINANSLWAKCLNKKTYMRMFALT